MVFCTKKPKCSREPNHPGTCNKKREIDHFYVASPFQAKHTLTSEINELANKKLKIDESISIAEVKLKNLTVENEKLENDLSGQALNLKKVEKKFEKLKILLIKQDYGRTRRESLPTSWEMISSPKTTRYNRLEETKNVLEYIHGGTEGALFGALDFIKRYASSELISKFVVDLKKGKFIEKLYGAFSTSFTNSDEGKNQAIAKKYFCYLSRSKYDFMNKIDNSIYDVANQQWNKKSIAFNESNIRLQEANISNYKLDKFVNELDIGVLH